ncbi:MAG: Translation machinery-associated protein 22 [Sarea resinae]|nr:MAG: Translation machinery-associated protein 22 [Sarea resinae]
MADTETAPAEPQARHVVYCGVCTLPPEYCEFGGTVKKCKDWLENNHPDLYERLYSDGQSRILGFGARAKTTDRRMVFYSLTANLSTLSVDAQKRAEKDAQKKAAKAEAAEAREVEKKQTSKVIIKRVERNKRKYVTAVSGLEAFGLELKKVAKDFGKKFATGSSVTKTPSGGEEIVVQGDLSDDIFDWITETYKDIPEDNIELIEDKKKKGGGAAAA